VITFVAREINVYIPYFHICFIPVFQTGDVNTISAAGDAGKTYYFLRLAEIKGDTVMAIHSNLEYNYFVNTMVGDDHFVKDDTTVYLKKRLKDMLEKNEIYMVTSVSPTSKWTTTLL
jgi:NADPH-dependent curcumin reductase CurA